MLAFSAKYDDRICKTVIVVNSDNGSFAVQLRYNQIVGFPILRTCEKGDDKNFGEGFHVNEVKILRRGLQSLSECLSIHSFRSKYQMRFWLLFLIKVGEFYKTGGASGTRSN